MQFYKLETTSNGKEIEYSTDFSFFISHQIRTISHSNGFTLCSAIENKTFKQMSNYEQRQLSDKAKYDLIASIHNDILQGKFGKGNLVN
jgi:hypothetical protein